MTISILVTAEPAPVQRSVAKEETGLGPRWAVWLRNGEEVRFLASGFSGLREAEEYGLKLAQEIALLGEGGKRVVRVN